MVGTPVTCLKGDDEKTWGHLAYIWRTTGLFHRSDEVDLGMGELKPKSICQHDNNMTIT